MREILFRGKTTPKEQGEFNNTWVYGDLIRSGGKFYIHPISNKVQVENDLGRLIVMHEVDPDTIGEFTWVLDKNNNKIFEGDIISCTIIYDVGCYPHYRSETRTVVYREGCFNPLYDCERNKYEIIGNIHDNPELLVKED